MMKEGWLIDEKLKAWQSQYDHLLNEEFPWDPNTLSDESPVEGPAIIITTESGIKGN